MGRWKNTKTGEQRIAVDGGPLERKLAGLKGWEPQDDVAEAAESMAKPNKSASKEQWVKYATEARGMAEDTANELTRDELAEAFADTDA